MIKEATMEKYCYDYPRPALTADVMALRWRLNQLEVLMIRRAKDPFKGQLALPGGFVDSQESPREAAARECLEETKVTVNPESLLEVGCFAAPDRDPRGWHISVAFVALLSCQVEAKAQDDAKEIEWLNLSEVIAGKYELAFDHIEIIHRTHEKLKVVSLTNPILLNLLDPPFRSRQARFLYRQIWGKALSPRSFKAWLRRVDMLERVGRALFTAKKHLKQPW